MPGSDSAGRVNLPSMDEQRAFYDAWNSTNRSGDYEQIDPRVTLRTNIALERIDRLDLPATTRVLEVGCGTGWLSARLCRYGSVLGVDLSPRAIEIAQARGISAEFMAADLCSLEPEALGTFDLVVCAETLFYVEDQRRFVERLARFTRSDGRLVLTMINRFVYERMDGVPSPAPGQIRQWLGRRQAIELLQAHFVVESIESFAPDGHRGILRIVNSVKINELLERIFAPLGIRRVKERLGLGSGFVIVCRRR